MIRLTNLCVLLLLIQLPVFGQIDEDIVRVSQEVNQGRYTGVEGSPYFYKEWRSGTIITADGRHHEHNLINFNGLTGDLEVKDDENVRKLLSGGFLKVSIAVDNRTDVFLRGIHSNFKMAIICVSYDGQRIKLLTEFNVRKDSYQDTRTGAEKFLPRYNYFLLFDDNLETISFNKKKIISVLGYATEIENYLKTNKKSIRSINDLVDLLTYFETKIL